MASFRVHALSKGDKEELLSPQELSIYASPAQNLRYVEEQPSFLQRAFGQLRVGLQPYARTVEGTSSLVKAGAANVYRAGQDAYRFLKDPSPGFLPRLSVITVSGLAGLVLARKGSQLKRLGVPLGMAAVSTAVCYPAQTVGVLKVPAGPEVDTSSVTAETTSRSLTLEPHIPVAPESVPTHIPEPELPSMKDFASPSILEPESPTMKQSIPPPLLEPQLPSGHESLPPSTPEPEVSSMEESVSLPILELELPTMKESIPLPTPELELPSGLESVLSTIPEPAKASVPPPIPEPESSTGGESSPAPIPESEHTSLLSLVSPSVKEPLPLFEPEFELIDEIQVSLEPEPESKVTVAAESGPVQESAFILCSVTTEKHGFPAESELLDHGQAEPEDADLYSTRS
uniref:MICOS complex subunit n=1 Tax=Scleropages formosus TaxID=113540 RepID=A0A8C9TTQ3_SCLFO